LSHLRWTVDEPQDFAFVEAIYGALYPDKPDFSSQDILRLLGRQSDLAQETVGIQRNEGFAKSLREDAFVGTPTQLNENRDE
jgi:spore coat polysaccharide biosynthesis protein SpsF